MEGNKMKSMYIIQTVIGPLTVIESENSITQIHFGEVNVMGIETRKTALVEETERQINAFYSGKRHSFDLPLTLHGTEFQNRVWKALLDIPKGETRSYKDIAEAVGNPNASRAVGMANNRNPIPVIIPCHRVIGKNGKLVGFAGGLDLKEKMLRMERENL